MPPMSFGTATGTLYHIHSQGHAPERQST